MGIKESDKVTIFRFVFVAINSLYILIKYFYEE